MRVLIVDDDEAITEFIAWALTDEGYEVEVAHNGASALELVARQNPDVILLDMRMPVMDGWQFARAYRQGRETPSPIVVMTAAQDAATRAGAVGATRYLGKPFNLTDLLDAVRGISSSPTTAA